jgi:hypothetical protein
LDIRIASASGVGGDFKTAKMSTERKNLVHRAESRLRDEPIVALLILIGTLVVATGEVVENWSNIMIGLGIKQDLALQLATQGAKGDFSRKFAELAWARLFWTRNFTERARRNVPQPDLDYSWNKHLDTVAAWSSELLVNINGFEEFYPNTDKSKTFDAINQSFRDLEVLVVDLRFSSDKGNAIKLIETINGQMDQLNVCLYWFCLNKLPLDLKVKPDPITVCSPHPVSP